MKGSIVKFALKSIAMWLIPTICVAILYYWLDPLRVARYHERYDPDRAEINRGVLSIRQFKHFYPTKKYDSFIIGSSVARHFLVEDWAKYIPEGSEILHFDSSAQTIEQMRLTLEFLERNAELNNALLVIMPHVFGFYKAHGMPFVQAPGLTESLWDDFCSYKDFVWHALDRRTISSYVARFWLNFRPIAESKINEEIPGLSYEASTNEECLVREDAMLQFARETLLERYPDILEFNRLQPRITKRPAIDSIYRAELQRIADILAANGTDYRLIMAPCQSEYLSSFDYEILHEIFGDRFYDFSESMVHYFHTPGYVYDHIHFSPFVSAEILRQVYSDR